MAIRIREATLLDVSRLYDISLRAHQSDVYNHLIPDHEIDRFKSFYTYNPQQRKSFESRIKYQISHKGHWVFVAVEGSDSPIGYGLISKHKEGYKLNGLFVDPDNQGKGVGSMIIKRKLEVASPGSAVHLLVISGNHRAIGLYKKLGFERVRQSRRRFFGAKQDHMIKVID